MYCLLRKINYIYIMEIYKVDVIKDEHSIIEVKTMLNELLIIKNMINNLTNMDDIDRIIAISDDNILSEIWDKKSIFLGNLNVIKRVLIEKSFGDIILN